MAKQRRRRERALVTGTDPVAADVVAAPRRTPIPLPKGWKRAKDALDRIESVSTIFPDFNRATRCGGLPVKRIHTVHGPTHGGKTGFVLGLIKSFVDGGHAAAYIDAEQSTPQEFVEELLGALFQHERLYALRPTTYEDTIDAVNSFLEMMVGVRKQSPQTYSLIVVDSINKLTPERELKNVLKSGGDEIAKGHAGRYRAALNQAWLNHLSPRLTEAGCAIVFIAQERDSGDGELWQPDGGVEVKGGQALLFDASLLIRVSKSMPLRDPSTARGDQQKGDIIGFAHRIRIYKSKVSHMDGAYSDCTFHLSNGKQTPAGFDTSRDALSVAKRLGLITVSGSWLSWRKHRWQGEMRAAQWLSSRPDALAGLLSEIELDLAASRRK